MRAEIKRDYRTCEICTDTVTHAIVVTDEGTATICVECWDRMVKAVESAVRRDEKKGLLI